MEKTDYNGHVEQALRAHMPGMKFIIKEIRKRENVVIRIEKGDIGGYQFVEIRQFVRDNEGEYVPTQKGLTFHPRFLDEVIEGLLEVKKSFPACS